MTTATRAEARANPDARPRPRAALRVALALAHADGKRLVRHPAVIAFATLTGVALWFGEGEVKDLSTAYGIGLAYFPLCAGVLLAANLMALRARRAGTEELFGVTATSQAGRTMGYVLAGFHAFVGGCAMLVIWVVFERSTGAIGWPDPFEALMGPVLILGATAAGVMLARFIPTSLAAIPGVVAIGLVTGALNSIEDTPWRFEWLAPWPGANDGLPAEAWHRPRALHVVYLVALATLLGITAMSRHRRDRRIAVAALAATLVAGLTGWAQARPPGEDAVRAAVAWLTQPDHRCVDRPAARLCVYPGYEQMLDRWARSVDPVLAAVPPDALPGRLEVTQRPSVEEQLEEIPPAVREALPARVLDGSWRRDGGIHPDFAWSAAPITSVALSVRAASWVVGLPLMPVAQSGTLEDGPGPNTSEDETGELPCYSGGQARAVLALWLTGLAHGGASTYAPAFNEDPDDGMGGGSVEAPGTLDITPPPWLSVMPRAVLWAESDLRLAIELLERPSAGATLRASWKTFADPSTTSEQLARALDLPLQPPAAVPELPVCR